MRKNHLFLTSQLSRL